eukprot:m.4788 g.4788  ORF g.4788 m.4788 type:complete len:1453 (+) comp11287_c0_seq1:97-4455(+)
MDSPLLRSKLDSLSRDHSKHLKQGWEAKCRRDGRLYYINHVTKTMHWLPPVENWSCPHGLPYGWELALDSDKDNYFLNHVMHFSTRKDPRKADGKVDNETKSSLKEIRLERSVELGFGFIAGSEKPVIIRSVLPGGPAEGKLSADDCIININDKNVEFASNSEVISVIKHCKEALCLTVRPKTSGIKKAKKSSLVTKPRHHSQKASDDQLKVRFADPIANAISTATFGPQNSPVGKDVFRVFLENGQIRSVRFNSTTTVQQVIRRECDRLSISCNQHFSLVMDGPGMVNCSYLPNSQLIEDVANLRSQSWKCRLRLRLITKEATDLLKKSPNAVDYLFDQTCNDVIAGRFGSDLTTDIAIKLGALHMQQHAVKIGPRNKISIKALEKDVGLDKFLPEQVLLVMKPKELRKMISHCVKLNQLMSLPGERHLTDIQAKLLYLKIAGELRTFGGRYYNGTYEKERSEVTLLVGPHVGFCHVLSKRRNLVSAIADFGNIIDISLGEVDSRKSRISIGIKKKETVSFILDSSSAVDLAHLLDGYRTLLTEEKSLLESSSQAHLLSDDTEGLTGFPYHSQHTVKPSLWSYSPTFLRDGLTDWTSKECKLDLRQPLPPYHQSRSSPLTVRLRKTGINLSDNDCYTSSSSFGERSSAHKRMLTPRRRSNSVDTEDVMESAAAEAAAREAAERATKALRRSSFAYSPPPSPRVLDELTGETESHWFVEIPEPLSVSSVFGDETISMESEDSSLHVLLESLNRRQSQVKKTANDSGIPGSESPGVRDSWSRIELTSGSVSDLRGSSGDEGYDETIPPPSEFSVSSSMNGSEPLPALMESMNEDDEDDGLVLPPPPGFGWSDVEGKESPDVDEIILQPPVEFTESFVHPEVDDTDALLRHGEVLKGVSPRQSVIVIDQVPSWLQEELRDNSPDDDDMDFIPPPPSLSDFQSVPSFGGWPENEIYLDIPPPILEEPEDEEFSPEPPDEFKGTELRVPPPPLPTTPVPKEGSTFSAGDETMERYPEPSIVPVSERTVQILTKTPSSSLLTATTGLKTSERRVPPPSRPRTSSSASLPVKGKESGHARAATTSRLSSLSSLSKLLPRSSSRSQEPSSPSFKQAQSPNKDRPSPKSYRAPQPPPLQPLANKGRSGTLTPPRPSPKLRRAPPPPNSASPVPSSPSRGSPLQHPRPWLPPSPGHSMHSPGSPGRSSSSPSSLSPSRSRMTATKVNGNSPKPKEKQPSTSSPVPPPLPYLPPPPLPDSSPPSMDTDEHEATDISPRKLAIHEACRTGIENLSTIVLELDTALQDVMTKKCSGDSNGKDFNQTKSALWANAKELTQETKTLVTAVVQKPASAVSVIDGTLATVDNLAVEARECVTAMTALKSDFAPPDVRQSLIVAVMEVASAFRNVLASAQEVVTSGMREPALMALMESAKAMATVMGGFTRTMNKVEKTMTGRESTSVA